MKHDTIMEASNPDYVLVEAEAERVAKDALRALKVSRQHCRLPFARGPTRDGGSALAGAPPPTWCGPEPVYGDFLLNLCFVLDRKSRTGLRLSQVIEGAPEPLCVCFIKAF